MTEEIDLFNTPYLKKHSKAITYPKIEISKAIKCAIENKNLSLRKVAKIIDDFNIDEYKASYTQLQRVTSGENYHIDTLLKLLDALDLKITIHPKEHIIDTKNPCE